MTPEFQDLCNRVAKIDAEAADWLRDKAPAYDPGNLRDLNFEPTGSLSTCMLWEATPQGAMFWGDISAKLGEWE